MSYGRHEKLKSAAVTGAIAGGWGLAGAALGDFAHIPASAGIGALGLAAAGTMGLHFRAGKNALPPYIKELGKGAAVAAAAGLAYAGYDLFATPFEHRHDALRFLTMSEGFARYGLGVLNKVDLSQLPSLLLNGSALGLTMGGLTYNGAALKWVMGKAGVLDRRLVRKSDERLGGAKWMEMCDAIDMCLTGEDGYSVPIGVVDLTLNEDMERREERNRLGNMSRVDPSSIETEVYLSKDVFRIPPPLIKPVSSHVLSFGSTRAGKGNTINATLLAPRVDVDGTYGMPRWKRRVLRRKFLRKGVTAGWLGGTMVIDPKAEALMVTMGRRLRIPGRKVVAIDPFNLVGEQAEKHGFDHFKGIVPARMNACDFIDEPVDGTILGEGREKVDLGKSPERGDELEKVTKTLMDGIAADFESGVRPGEELFDKTRKFSRFGEMIINLIGLLIPKEKNVSGDGEHFRLSAALMLQGLLAWVCAVYPKGDPRRSLRYIYDILKNALLVDAMFTGKGFPAEWYEDGDPEKPLKAEYRMWNLMDPMWQTKGEGMPGFAASRLKNSGDRERPTIIGSLMNALSWMGTEAMREHVTVSDFDMDEWFAGNVDLFICVPPSMLASGLIAGYLRIWAGMPIMLAPYKQHIIKGKNPKNRLLMILDEAGRFGKIDALAAAYGLLAGFGLSVWMIFQDYSQFVDVYGKETADNIISNAADFVHITKVAQGDLAGAERFSKIIGEETVRVVGGGDNSGGNYTPGSFGGAGSYGANTSWQLQKRPLVSPDELAQMQDGDAVALLNVRGKERNPFRFRTVDYFKHPDFMPHMLPNPYQTNEGPSEAVKQELKELLRIGGIKPVEVPKGSLFPEGLLEGLNGEAGPVGPMKLDKKNAEGIAPPKPSNRAAGITDDEWGDSVAVPDMSDLMAAIDRGDDREDDRFPDHADDRIPPDADFSGDQDDEPM